MPPTLPSSLSPHICILASPDLQDILEAAQLPPLPQILQCFSPLPQITTRTTSLTSVPHASFALRFSDLAEIEEILREDEEQRAGRTMDWIAARVSSRSSRWVEAVNSKEGMDGIWKEKTPWWEEVKRCIEGDHTPTSDEGWNHPVALIFAVSTSAVNPLQALQDLHARLPDFPPWVDSVHLRYSLIVHPSNSPLADPIADSLFNAVKKQHGLHSYMLPLALPTSPLPPPVPVPAFPPRLPPPPQFESPTARPMSPPTNLLATSPPAPVMSPIPRSAGPPGLSSREQPPSPTAAGANSLRLIDSDIKQIGRFTREFVTMSLVPWMEKCVVDWNENYSSSRRLPSRLFSSTRRLFGSGYTSSAPSAPSHGSNASISSISSRTHGPRDSVSSISSVSSLSTLSGNGPAVTQQRRLAEFATILGDYKLATSVWEALRKEGRGGSDILPLLLAPSPALALHAAHALTTLYQNHRNHQSQNVEAPAHVQYRALVYAVRWETGIDRNDFLSNVLDGEQWLVHAAGSAEDPTTSLSLAHAAFLSEQKNAKRRSALWYLFSADRLEKSGIKPLAMHFFRKSHELYKAPVERHLSPAFWESEGVDASEWRGFEAVLTGIEHELGRLLYTTGDTAGAVRFFLGLLRWSMSSRSLPRAVPGPNGVLSPELRQTDKIYIEDFKVAFKHFRETEGDKWKAAGLQLPVSFCQVKHTHIRFPGDAFEGDSSEWDKREQDWKTFWTSRGKEKLEKSGKGAVDETFWVDLVLRNPLDVEVTLSGFTVGVRESSSEDGESAKEFVEVEVIDGIVLGAKDTRTIPVSVKCKRSASLILTHVQYDFLELLPATESLAVRGRRLHDTPLQRANKIYGPDVLMKVEVEEAGQRLHVNLADDRHSILAQGEYKTLKLWLTNSGTRQIGELWLVPGANDAIWIDVDEPATAAPASSSAQVEIFQSSNSLSPRTPYRIPLAELSDSPDLAPSESMQIPLILHASHVAEQDLYLLFVFREGDGLPFHSSRVTWRYEVSPILHISAQAQPSHTSEHALAMNMDVENVTAFNNVWLTQITTMSANWACTPLTENACDVVEPRQVTRLAFGISKRSNASGSVETLEHVSRKLRDVVLGNKTDTSDPPPLELECRHLAQHPRSVCTPSIRHFIHSARRTISTNTAASSHPHIPESSYRSIFPLYNPNGIDVVIFWHIPNQARSGHILISGVNVGAGHAALKEIIEEAENAKVKRSMYAETDRERLDVLEAVRNCEWNAEMDPVVVSLEDGSVVEHNFTHGPCRVPVTFTLRNHSLTNPVQTTLKLTAKIDPSRPTSNLLPPPFSGKLTHKRFIAPSESVSIRTKLWAARPGSYALDGWTMETEVGERTSGPPEASGSSSSIEESWRTRGLRYLQGPAAGDQPCITVVDCAPPIT